MSVDLETYLKECGKTKKAFAKEAGVTYPTLWNVMTKNVIPSLKTALAIEKASKGKVRVKDLMTKKESFDIEIR